jgi:hypothetical protein
MLDAAICDHSAGCGFSLHLDSVGRGERELEFLEWLERTQSGVDTVFDVLTLVFFFDEREHENGGGDDEDNDESGVGL